MPALPAHLNLDVRHSLRDVELLVAIDGKPALEEKLVGSGKRFKVFGKRAERGYTKTLDLTPGAHLVRVRVRSAADKFDQTRVERFELGSASVAALRISADSSGLSLVAERPPAPEPETAPPPARQAAPQIKVPTPAAVPPAPAPAPALQPLQATALPTGRTTQETTAVVELLQSVRSMLIAIAGFVASAATGFIVQEYLRRRKPLMFPEEEAAGEDRKRRRAGFAG